MATLVSHDAYESHALVYGHPAFPTPLPLRLDQVARGETVTIPHGAYNIITPPPPGHCCHCGVVCGPTQNVRQHAVAGYEWMRHPESDERMRFVVTHCDGCLDTDACSREETTPGSGVVDGAGGFCEPMPSEIALGISLFPGARQAGRFLTLGFAALAAWLLSNAAIVTSQGQQVADFAGPVTSLLVPGDSTSGHGFNAGLLRVLSGSAPATANAAETGTLGISWTMAAQAFPLPTAATPEVVTAGGLPLSVAISNTITAGYGRLVMNGDGAGISTTDRRYQYAVGTSGSDMNFNTLSLVAAGTASCTAFTITHG